MKAGTQEGAREEQGELTTDLTPPCLHSYHGAGSVMLSFSCFPKNRSAG